MAIALIDCNNFYCSCERVFDPKLKHTPVIVMSNNDGCAIARTNEVKKLGLPMGAPIFKWRSMINRHGIALRSANFVLYGDMSRRVNLVLQQFSPDIEIYSIDESFLALSGIPQRDLTSYGHDIRRRVLQWTGLPSCVGIAPTKTLAKLANTLAKKNPLFNGVCNLMDENVRNRLLPDIKIEDIWGIGRALRAKLYKQDVTTAAELRDMHLPHARKTGTVVLERLVQELNAIACIDLETAPLPRKTATVSRSFGSPVENLTDMMASIAQHTARCGEKLRRAHLVAGNMTIFMQTSKYRHGPQHYGTKSICLCPMTDDSRDLLNAARKLTESLFRTGYSYTKSGVILDDLRHKDSQHPDMFAHTRQGHDQLMAALDKINGRYGHMTVFPASQGINRPWKMRQQHLSPRYTTCIQEVPVAWAK